MNENDWHVYCPSYKRSTTAESHKHFTVDRFTYVVRENEAADYVHHGVKVLTIPTGAVSNVAETRNWILDHTEHRHTIMVDDDISEIATLKHRVPTNMGPHQIARFIDSMYDFCFAMNVGYWGLNITSDPLQYAINSPLSFRNPVLGPFCGHVVDEIRYDEQIHLKEDYDFWLQKIAKYGMSLRSNYVHYKCDHGKRKGGCQEYRTIEEEERQKKLFQDKWGSEVVRHGERENYTVNMRIRVPKKKK